MSIDAPGGEPATTRRVLGRWMPSRLDYHEQLLVLVVMLGLLARVAWLVYALRTPVGYGDSQFYMQTASRLADGKGYVGPSGQATALWPPGYPFVLAFPTWIVEHTFVPGGQLLAGALLNLVLGTATVALVGVVGRRLLGPVSGVVAAGIVGLFPSLVMYTAALLSETLFVFLAMVVVAVLVHHPWGTNARDSGLPSTRRLVIAGAVAGFSVLVRPTFLPSLLLVPVAMFVASRNARVTLAKAASFLLPIGAVVLPWTIRNVVVMDAAVPISTNTGYNLCIGNNPDATGAYILSDYCFADLPLDDTTAAEVERNRLTSERGSRWLFGHLVSQFRLVPLRTFSMFANDSSGVPAMNSYGADPWMSVRTLQIWSWICDAYFFGVAALAVVGMLAWRPHRDRRKLVLLMMIAGAVVATWPFFGDTRFKLPILPLLALFAVIPLRVLKQPAGSPVGPPRRGCEGSAGCGVSGTRGRWARRRRAR